jgi:galactoside O-acetyltransferase
MRAFEKLKDLIFYDPYRAVRKSKNVIMGQSQLAPEFRLHFNSPREDVALRIGDRCLLRNVFVFERSTSNITLGDGVFINCGTKVMSGCSIEIGNEVTIGWGCLIYDHDAHSMLHLDRIVDQNHRLIDFLRGDSDTSKDWRNVAAAPIKICDYVWLGFDVVVLKGVTIGEGAVVGARAVVTTDVPPWTVAAGNPARVVKQIPRDLQRH